MDVILEKWNEILMTVKKEHDISDIAFDTFLRPLEIYGVENNTVYILVPFEQLGPSYISKKYSLPLKVAIAEITGIEYKIEFIMPEQTKNIKKSYGKKKQTLILIIHLILLSLEAITVLHILHPLRLRNLREKHTTLFISTEVPDLAKPTLCIRSDTLY